MKIAFWDLETSNLSALMGRILCSSILPLDGKRPVTFISESADPLDDADLCNRTRDALDAYNVVVTWNGKLFDRPYLNARLVKWGEPIYNPQMHLDMMWHAGGGSARIGSKKLVNVQKYFHLHEKKTELDWEDWQRAAAGDKEALAKVIHHCEQDVRVLRRVYWKLIPFVRNIHR